MKAVIDSVKEFEGDGTTVAYQARGHLDPGIFLAILTQGWGFTAHLDDVHHRYYRVIPAMGTRGWQQRCGPGRGAFAATEVAARHCRISTETPREGATP